MNPRLIETQSKRLALVEFGATVTVNVSPSPPDAGRGLTEIKLYEAACHVHAPRVRVIFTVNWPPLDVMSTVPPGEIEYVHAPNCVTVTLVLPVGHDSVSVPDRGVPAGFASTR